MTSHAWGGNLEAARKCPLVRYLLTLASIETLVEIDTEQVALRMGIKRDSVAQELRQLQDLGALRYSAEKHSRAVLVRVLAPPETPSA